MKKTNLIIALLVFLLIVTLVLLIYLTKEDSNYQKMNFKKHIPINLSKEDILISFRLDDADFSSKQKPVLENALNLARKYNITFDLAVIAKRFDENSDKYVFRIYQYNQDVFEIVAHGWDHTNPINSSSKGEFFDFVINKSIPYEIQEEHIKNMNKIFKKYNLTSAMEVLICPFNTGDINTTLIAEKYGYKMITKSIVGNQERNLSKIVASNSYVTISMNSTISINEINGHINEINHLINRGTQHIQIVLHPVNLDDSNNFDTVIVEILNNLSYNPKIKFSFISDLFKS